jgi:fatty-acyl-CoA synthase
MAAEEKNGEEDSGMREWDGKTTLGTLPALAAERFGDREALVFRDLRLTFRELADNIDRVAKGLIQVGIRPGEKVGLWLNNCPEWIYSMFALAKIGAVQVPVNTRFRTADTEYVLKQSDCSTLITHDVSGPIDYLAMARELVPREDYAPDGTIRSGRLPELRRLVILGRPGHEGTIPWTDVLAAAAEMSDEALGERAAAVSATDTLFIMYTSGTTGFPKGVMRDHRLIRNQCDRIIRLDTTENDVMLNYLPLFHIFGYVDGPLLSVMTGNRQVLTETFVADACLDLVERERVTQMHGFETHLKDLVEAQERKPRDISSLRTGIFAVGMNSAVAVARKAGTVLAPLKSLTAYGMTEIGANVSLSLLDSTEEQRCESSGLPCEGYEIRVIDPVTGKDQPTGTPGEMIVKTFNIMQAYYKRPEETAKAFDEDGWFHSGDMGLIRPDGYIRFLGRYKDMLKIGGENVDPMEVEGYLLGHPGIHMVAVVGHPDQRLTEVPAAFVVPVAGASLTEQDVIEHCKGKIASFKIPRHVVFVDELPMTTTGKVQKAKLRAATRNQKGGDETASD